MKYLIETAGVLQYCGKIVHNVMIKIKIECKMLHSQFFQQCCHYFDFPNPTSLVQPSGV